MQRLYSPSSGCTYLVGLNTDIPTDAVEISDEVYDQVIANPASGMVRSHDAEGVPFLIPMVDPTPDYPALVAATRFEKEVAGLVWNDYYIATDRESQNKIGQEISAIASELREDPSGWKCQKVGTSTTVFRSTTDAEMREISAAVYKYVSACFAREDQLLTAIMDGSFSPEMLEQGWP